MRTFIYALSVFLFLTLAPSFAEPIADEICVSGRLGNNEGYGHAMIFYLDLNRANFHTLELPDGHREGQAALHRSTRYLNFGNTQPFSMICLPLSPSQERFLDQFIDGQATIKGSTLQQMLNAWSKVFYNCADFTEDVFEAVTGIDLPVGFLIARPGAIEHAIRAGKVGTQVMHSPTAFHDYICDKLNTVVEVNCNPEKGLAEKARYH